MLADLLSRFGLTGKLVKEYCRQMGWRHGPHGAPAEWYRAWSEGLSLQVEEWCKSRCQ